MARLIDADALFAVVRRHHDLYKGATNPPDKARRDECLQIMCDINDAPTVDAEPVKYGVWVPIDDEPHEDFECSVCGYVSTASFDCSGITPNVFPYCPMCGAKMDGGET